MKQIAIAICFFTLNLPLFSQHSLTGNISDENNLPIPGAIIEVHELGKRYLSNPEGDYKIHNLKTGTYHIHITSIGFHFHNETITIQDSSTILNVQLHESINELHEVTIETSPFKDDQKSSSLIIQSVDEKFIEKSGGATLMGSLEKIEGVQSINTGVGISKPVIRGLSGNRVIVNDAGIKQEGQQWGAEHGLELDQYGVEQVEIIKGPAALAYGSDAIGGVINIRRTENPTLNTFKGNTKGIYRSYNNTYGVSLGAKLNSNNNILKFRATGLDYGDYKVPATSYNYLGYILPIENGKLKNTAGYERNLSATMGVNRNWGFSHLTISNFDQKIGFFPGATGIPRSYTLTDDGDYRNVELPYQTVNHTKVISNSSFNLFGKWTELDAGYQFNNRNEFSKPDSHGRPVSDKDSLATALKLHTLSANLKFHNKTFKTWESVYGIQTRYQINNVGGFEFIIPNYTDIRAGIYTLLKKKINEKLHFNGGVRLESSIQKSEATDMPFYNNKVIIDTIERSPKINKTYLNYAAGFGFSYLLKKHSSLKLNFGKTYRIPNFAELASNGGHTAAFRFEKGDPNLNPEEGYQTDLGFLYESKKLHIGVNGYFNYFSNFIYLSPKPYFASEEIDGIIYPYPGGGQLYQYSQASAIHTGGEMNIHYHINNQWALGLVSEYTFGQNLDEDTPLPFFPPFSVKPSLEYEKDFKGKLINTFGYQLTGNFVSAQNRTAKNEKPTNAYTTLDFNINATFGKTRDIVELNVTVSNLTNEKYFNNLSRYRLVNIPEPARNINISLTYNFAGKIK